MKCPKCSKELVKKSVEGQVTIDLCEEHGLWLDHGELRQLILMDRKGRRKSRRRSKDSAKSIAKTLVGFYNGASGVQSLARIYKVK